MKEKKHLFACGEQKTTHTERNARWTTYIERSMHDEYKTILQTIFIIFLMETEL